jgi:hypothetical protein
VECVKCGAPVTPPTTGRPPRYCSTGCRRAAEYELQRLQRHLEAAEREVTCLKHMDPAESVEPSDYSKMFHVSKFGKQAGKALANATAEIARLEARMRQLLALEEQNDDGLSVASVGGGGSPQPAR